MTKLTKIGSRRDNRFHTSKVLFRLRSGLFDILLGNSYEVRFALTTITTSVVGDDQDEVESGNISQQVVASGMQ